MNNPSSAPSGWRRVIKHALFPFVLYLVLTQVIRDNYPFFHYPMYSNPSSEPVRFQFLADEDGQPLPVMWLTGMSPSQLCKILRHRKGKFTTEEEAALNLLSFVREQNAPRKKRKLPESIQLMETTLSFPAGSLVETHRSLAMHTVKETP